MVGIEFPFELKHALTPTDRLIALGHFPDSIKVFKQLAPFHEKLTKQRLRIFTRLCYLDGVARNMFVINVLMLVVVLAGFTGWEMCEQVFDGDRVRIFKCIAISGLLVFLLLALATNFIHTTAKTLEQRILE